MPDLEPASARGGGCEERRHLAFHDHLADKGLAIEPGRIDGKWVAGFHPERRRVYNKLVAGGIVMADLDRELRIMPAQACGEALRRTGASIGERYRAGGLGGD